LLPPMGNLQFEQRRLACVPEEAVSTLTVTGTPAVLSHGLTAQHST
jgi:hypothetical protein